MVHTAKCEECGQEFSWHRNRPRKYCSRRCGYIANGRSKRTSVEAICDHCGIAFEKKLSQHTFTQKHFCSRSCMGKWQSQNWIGKDNPTYSSVDCTCTICGKEFTRTPFHISNGEGKFCSNKCKGVWISENRSGPNSPYWRGGKVRYRGADWKRQCEQARKRDKHRCQRCGIHEKKLSYKLDVHHIVPYRSFPRGQYKLANQLCNLISLCRSCHIRIEKGNIPVQSRFL